MLTDAQLAKIMPNLAAARRALYLPHLNAAMQANGVTTLLRIAGFVAQLAHESGEFRWMEEIWGPTDAQRRYEPPNALAAKLGNTQAGDGLRFKGRGPIQITGRFNYAKYGGLLGIDLIADPPRAAAPDVAFATAGLFWKTNGLNQLADAQQFITITRRINGGTNGLADRQQYYAKAQAVLAQGFTVGAVSRGARSVALPAVPAAALTRGHEAIRKAVAAVAKTTAGNQVTAKAVAKGTAVKKVATKKAATKKDKIGKATVKPGSTTKASAKKAAPR